MDDNPPVRPLLRQKQMISRKSLVLTIIGAATVGAAAAGGFIAVRMNHADLAVATVGAPDLPVPTPVVVKVPRPAAPDPVSLPDQLTVREPSAGAAPATDKPSNSSATAQRRSALSNSSNSSGPVSSAPLAPPPVAAPSSSTPSPSPTPVTSSPAPIAPPVIVPVAAPPAMTADAPPVTVQQAANLIADGSSSTGSIARFEDLVLAADSVIGIRVDANADHRV